MTDDFVKKAAERLLVAEPLHAVQSDGRDCGRRWAGPEGSATTEQLLRLEREIAHSARLDRELPIEHFLYVAGGGSPGVRLFRAIHGRDGSIRVVRAFWGQVLGSGGTADEDRLGMIDHWEFAGGFIKGALEVWRKACEANPQLKPPVPSGADDTIPF